MRPTRTSLSLSSRSQGCRGHARSCVLTRSGLSRSGHVLDASVQKVRPAHAVIEGAEDMLDGAFAHSHGVGHQLDAKALWLARRPQRA